MFKKCIIYMLISFITTIFTINFAFAITLSINPSSQVVLVGDSFDVSIEISGLGNLTTPSLSTFDLVINFDPAILAFKSLNFGDQLDLFGLGSLIEVDTSSAGIINLFELSLDSVTDLNSLQIGNFALAILRFETLDLGKSPLNIFNVILGDAWGDPLIVDNIENGTVVTNIPPTANAGGPYTVNEGITIVFTATATDPGNDLLEYRWDFDNDGRYDTEWSLNPSASYMWNDDYTGTVIVQVRDDYSAVDTDSAIVKVDNVPPSVEAGPESTGECCAYLRPFSGTFFDPGLFDNHTIEWNFGDGHITTGTLTPSHKYCSIGEYTVNLIVRDDDGGIGSDDLIVTIRDTIPSDVTISSPLETTYYNTKEPIQIIYTLKDICDLNPEVNVFLDGELFTEATIDLNRYLGETDHILNIQAIDASGNLGKDSVTFNVIPKSMKCFFLKLMRIRWAYNHSNNYSIDKTKIKIFGSFELPDEYQRADLNNSAFLYIQIADKLIMDMVVLSELQNLWFYSENPRKKEDDSLGEGINIRTMHISWFSDDKNEGKNYRKKKYKKAKFRIMGELFLNEMDIFTLLKEAIITLEIPVSNFEKSGSLAGKEIIKFTKRGNKLFYHRPKEIFK